MKITIDTKDDSHEDIKKVIRLLQNMVGQVDSGAHSNIFDDSSSSLPSGTGESEGLFNMFGSSDEASEGPQSPESEKSEEEEESFSGVQIVEY